MNALEEALARREQAGLDAYAGHEESLLAPVRPRVRRARTMRGIGASVAAVVALGLAAAGAVALSGPANRTVDSAGPLVGVPAGALYAEDLLPDARMRTRDLVADDSAQDAVRCEVGTADNPWARPTSYSSVRGEECDAVRLIGGELVRVVPGSTEIHVTRSPTESTVEVTWTVENVSADTTVVVDQGATVTGLVVDGLMDGGPSVAAGGYYATSGWMSAATRIGVLSNGTDPVALEPGERLESSHTFVWKALESSLAQQALAAVIFGEALPSVEVQLRVVPRSAPGDIELLLEASTDDPTVEIVDAADGDGATATDLTAVLAPRQHNSVPVNSPQAALHCWPDPDTDVRWGKVDQLDIDVVCSAHWVSESPLLELDQLTFSVDGDELDVDYTLTNVAGFPLALDIGAAAVTVSTEPDTAAGAGMSVGYSQGALWGDQLWVSDTERFGLLTHSAGASVLPDGAMFGSEARFPLSEVPTDGSGEWSIQVPVAGAEGAEDAVLLEVIWDGEELPGAAEG